MTFDQVRTFLLQNDSRLQWWVNPMMGFPWNILAEGEAIKITPFPLLFNIFLASTFILSDYLIFSWTLYTMSNLSYPKVVHDTLRILEHVKFSSCNFSPAGLILVSPSFNICYTFVFKWLSIIGLDVHGLPRWLKG